MRLFRKKRHVYFVRFEAFDNGTISSVGHFTDARHDKLDHVNADEVFEFWREYVLTELLELDGTSELKICLSNVSYLGTTRREKSVD